MLRSPSLGNFPSNLQIQCAMPFLQGTLLDAPLALQWLRYIMVHVGDWGLHCASPKGRVGRWWGLSKNAPGQDLRQVGWRGAAAGSSPAVCCAQMARADSGGTRGWSPLRLPSALRASCPVPGRWRPLLSLPKQLQSLPGCLWSPRRVCLEPFPWATLKGPAGIGQVWTLSLERLGDPEGAPAGRRAGDLGGGGGHAQLRKLEAVAQYWK